MGVVGWCCESWGTTNLRVKEDEMVRTPEVSHHPVLHLHSVLTRSHEIKEKHFENS